MPKERNYNPVQAQRKADKAKAIKKGKSEIQNRRNEKLARRNPNRIQKQIDDLKAITASGGKLTSHEEQVLNGLEKDLASVNKAREALGDKAPSFGRGYGSRDDSGPHGVLGKRRRDFDRDSSDDDVPDDVKQTPMPRDTPPPIPKNIMDEWWARRRARRQAERGEDQPSPEDKKPSPAPVAEAKTVYEAKPMVRNLQQEAVSAFVPSAVRTKMAKGKGQGGLMEPEEADRLEREGYLKASSTVTDARPHGVTVEDVEDDDG